MVVDKLGTTFAALSDPTRRVMIERLSHGPASVHGLTEPFALSQQMISKHIAYLVRARSFDKLDVVVNQMKKAEVRDDKKHG
jgi:DNA-binding transcriptional ArsR family regulator